MKQKPQIAGSERVVAIDHWHDLPKRPERWSTRRGAAHKMFDGAVDGKCVVACQYTKRRARQAVEATLQDRDKLMSWGAIFRVRFAL